jgi:hypothetical protein
MRTSVLVFFLFLFAQRTPAALRTMEDDSSITIVFQAGHPAKKIPLTPHLTLSAAVIQALPKGVLLPGLAKLTRARSTSTHDLTAIRRGWQPDPVLHPDDRIYTPAIYLQSFDEEPSAETDAPANRSGGHGCGFQPPPFPMSHCWSASKSAMPLDQEKGIQSSLERMKTPDDAL